MRTAHLPLDALSIRGQDKCALARACQNSYLAHSCSPPEILAVRDLLTSSFCQLLRFCAQPLLLLTQFRSKLSAKVFGLKDLPDLDLRLTSGRVRAALRPVNRL